MNGRPVLSPEKKPLDETNPVIALGMLHLAMLGIANIEVICG